MVGAGAAWRVMFVVWGMYHPWWRIKQWVPSYATGLLMNLANALFLPFRRFLTHFGSLF